MTSTRGTRHCFFISLAICAHRDGGTEQACRQATAALAALPADYRTGLIRARAMDLYQSILAQHHHEPAVRDLRNALAA